MLLLYTIDLLIIDLFYFHTSGSLTIPIYATLYINIQIFFIFCVVGAYSENSWIFSPGTVN